MIYLLQLIALFALFVIEMEVMRPGDVTHIQESYNDIASSSSSMSSPCNYEDDKNNHGRSLPASLYGVC